MNSKSNEIQFPFTWLHTTVGMLDDESKKKKKSRIYALIVIRIISIAIFIIIAWSDVKASSRQQQQSSTKSLFSGIATFTLQPPCICSPLSLSHFCSVSFNFSCDFIVSPVACSLIHFVHCENSFFFFAVFFFSIAVQTDNLPWVRWCWSMIFLYGGFNSCWISPADLLLYQVENSFKCIILSTHIIKIQHNFLQLLSHFMDHSW